jgi:arginine utilization protein RocB
MTDPDWTRIDDDDTDAAVEHIWRSLLDDPEAVMSYAIPYYPGTQIQRDSAREAARRVWAKIKQLNLPIRRQVQPAPNGLAYFYSLDQDRMGSDDMAGL